MDERTHTAARANQSVYDSGWTEKFREGAPHLKHASIRALFDRLLRQAFERLPAGNAAPRFLDIGAGEGSVTRRLLELGARVTAIDVSASQLAELQRKCAAFGDRLEVRQGDVGEVLMQLDDRYDVVVASACLHHLPDYLGLVRDATARLNPACQFLSFQDPLRYDRLGRFTRTFDELSYHSWRAFQGDLWGGFQRRQRRRRGQFDDSPLDNAEYHVVRNGVDQDAIVNLLQSTGFDCDLVRYFSTQSRVFQPLGSALGICNTFAIVAHRHTS